MVVTHSRVPEPLPLPNRRTTLALIAERAHVSVPTVSKVVNGRTGVGEDTRQRVLAIAEELGYVTAVERRLSYLAEPTIELLLEPIDSQNPYLFEFIGGAMQAAGELGAALVTRRIDLVPQLNPTSWAKMLTERHRAGVIEVTTRYAAERERALRAVGLPMVLVDPIDFPRTATMSVGATNWAGAYEATNYLLDLGHTRISYIGGPAQASCDIARASGWAAAMQERGYPADLEAVERQAYSFQHGLDSATRILSVRQPPTAIFAGADIVAMGVLEAARRLHIAIPDDLSVVGFDDTVFARASTPNLTTVHQPIADIGAAAVNALLRLARGETFTTKRVELSTHLVIRGSTVPPR